MKAGEYLRVHIPVGTLDVPQRARAVAIANRVERKLATLLSNGVDPDRIMDKVEGYFPE